MPRPPHRRARAALTALVAVTTVAACAGDAPERAAPPAGPAVEAPVVAVDDDGDTVRLPRPARRLIGLVPSTTDIALALGARDQLAGRTRYDVRPEVADLPSVGGGLDPSVETLVGLRPDLLVTWQGPERDRAIARVADAGIPTFSLRPDDTTGALSAIARLGRLLGRDSAAAATIAAIRADLDAVRRSVAGRERPTVFYAIGTSPPRTVSAGGYLHQLVDLAGGDVLFVDAAQPSPQVSLEELVRRQPDVIVLSVGGDDGAARASALAGLPGWRDLRAVREGRVLAVPADLVNRAGPEMGRAARLLRDLLHPAVADPAAPDSTR